MTTREKAPTILTRRAQAEGRLRVIRNALAVADEELAAAYAAKDWEAFGLPNWAAYCAELLPELQHIKLRAPARRARAAALLELGASRRDLAAATGCDVATAHRDALVIEGRAVANATPAERPVTTPPASLSTVERAVALVAAQGSRGLTYIELCAATGWRGGQATGALSRAEKRGLIRRVPTFRDRCAAYIAN